MPDKNILQQNKCDGSDWKIEPTIYNNLYGYIKWKNAYTGSDTPFSVLKKYAAGQPDTSPLADGGADEIYGNVNKLLSDPTLVFLNDTDDSRTNKINQNLINYFDAFKQSVFRLSSNSNVGAPAPNDFVIIPINGKPKKFVSAKTAMLLAGTPKNVFGVTGYKDEFNLDGDVIFYTQGAFILKNRFKCYPGIMTSIEINHESTNINLRFSVYLKFSINIKILPSCNDTTYREIIMPLNDTPDKNFYYLKLYTVTIPYHLQMTKTIKLIDQGGNYINPENDPESINPNNVISMVSVGSPGNLQSKEAINTVKTDNGSRLQYFNLYTKAFVGENDKDPAVQLDDPFGAITSNFTDNVIITLNKVLHSKINDLFNNEQKPLGDQLKRYGLPKDSNTKCIKGCISDIDINMEYKVCCDTYNTALDDNLSVSQLKDFILEIEKP